jgi:hypothetical protein
MVAQGGVGIVTIVAMVRAVSMPTKRYCAIALLNLLSEVRDARERGRAWEESISRDSTTRRESPSRDLRSEGQTGVTSPYDDVSHPIWLP